MDFKIILVLTIIYFLSVKFLFKLFKSEILHPIFIINFYWFTLIFISLLCSYFFKLKINLKGILPILLLLGFFTFGSLFYYYKHQFTEQKETTSTLKINTNLFLYTSIFFSLLALSSIFIQIKYLNLKISSFKDILSLPNQISLIRYTEKRVIPFYGQILYSFLFSASYISGFIIPFLKRKKNKLAALLPILISFIISFINGGKFIFIVAIIFTIAAYFSSLILINENMYKIFIKNLSKLIILILLFLIIITLIQKFRAGYNEKIDIKNFYLTYFSSFNAFSLWWDNFEFKKPSIGKYTFSGIHNMIFKNRKMGLFKEFLTLNDKQNIRTNVYTAFRAFIEDYSLPFSLIIFLLSGYLITYVYEKLKRKYFFAHVIYSAFIVALLWSICAFIYTYNTIIFTIIINFCFLFISSLKITIKDNKIIKIKIHK